MRKIIVVLFAVLFLSCEKDSELTQCQKENIGYLSITNNSNHSFDVFIDNVHYRQIPGKSVIRNISFEAGDSYQIFVKQIAGYILYPTQKTFQVTINMCDEKQISFTD